MKANELRIGNFINYRIVDKIDERQEWDEVSIIDGEDLYYLQKNPNDLYFQPIPLIEEWLLKFGFIKYFNEYILDGFSFTFDENKFYNHIGKITNVYYVHQLQNLYFCLCGKELEVER